MNKGKVGTLKEINGTTIMIDDTWYDGSNIAQYIPKTKGITVEYSADDNNVLAFVRERRAYTPKSGVPKGGSFAPKPGFKDQSSSIIKQVIFKEASNIVNKFTFSSPDDALDEVYRIYMKAKEKFADELK